MSQRSEPDERPAPVGLSVTQIMASALAAVTTTWALSFLGVAGTIIGAGLASVVTVLGNHIYMQSIERTRRQVRAYRPSRYAASAQTTDISPTVALEVQDPTRPIPAVTEEGRSDHDPARSGGRNRRPLIVSIVAVFLLIMAGVTAFELVNGRTLSDTVKGTQGSGTTIFGGTGATVPVPSATGTGTSTPTSSTPVQTSTTTTTTVPGTSTSAPTSSAPTTSTPAVTQTSPPPILTVTP